MNVDEAVQCAEHFVACKRYINLVCDCADNIVVYIKNNNKDDLENEITHLYHALTNLYNRRYVNQRFLDGVSIILSDVYLFYAHKKECYIEYFYKLQSVFEDLKND